MDRPDIVRGFNRFYTRRLRLLREGLLNGPLSLTEARVLFELVHREEPSATGIAAALDLDAGYLSRILESFARKGYVKKGPSREDRRHRSLSVTKAGLKLFESLNAKSHQQASDLLAGLSDADQSKLIDAMKTIENILEPKAAAPVTAAHASARRHWMDHASSRRSLCAGIWMG